MLGLEENMNEPSVVDIRPERFLRAMRDTGDWAASCMAAGIDSTDAANLMLTDVGFDRCVIECLKEHYEEKAIEEREATIKSAHLFYEKKMMSIKESLDNDFYARHPELKDTGEKANGV